MRQLVPKPGVNGEEYGNDSSGTSHTTHLPKGFMGIVEMMQNAGRQNAVKRVIVEGEFFCIPLREAHTGIVKNFVCRNDVQQGPLVVMVFHKGQMLPIERSDFKHPRIRCTGGDPRLYAVVKNSGQVSALSGYANAVVLEKT